jgi:hypothetical protein
MNTVRKTLRPLAAKQSLSISTGKTLDHME